jgi:hypothetical protein
VIPLFFIKFKNYTLNSVSTSILTFYGKKLKFSVALVFLSLSLSPLESISQLTSGWGRRYVVVTSVWKGREWENNHRYGSHC